MTRLVMQYIRDINGIPVYAPVDRDDVKALDNQSMIVCDVKGNGSKAKRSGLQNKSIHKYCSMLSDAFNDAGFDMPTVIKRLFKKPSLRWSPEAVKDRLWKEIQLQTFDFESTAKLDTAQVSLVYESMNVATSQTMGISVSFPSYDYQLLEQYSKER